jgi:hypothetical protein
MENECEITHVGRDVIAITGTGYQFDSGRPNRLWFGLFPFDGRVHNLSVSCWLDCDGLLHQAVEEFTSAARFAAVEAEREFV